MLIFFTYIGARKGIVDELMGWTGWVVALLIALAACDIPAAFLKKEFRWLKDFSTLIAISAILLLVRIFIQVVADKLTNMMKNEQESMANYIGGSILGFFKGLFILSVLVLTIAILPFKSKIKNLENGSVLFNHVGKFSVYIVQTVAKHVPKTRTAVNSIVRELERTKSSQYIPKKKRKIYNGEGPLTEKELEEKIQKELKDARSKNDLRR
jgi:uncharacterized membrane protein required for colicin V production